MVGKSGFWTHARLRGGFRHDILEYPDRFDILLKKKPSGVVELRHAMLYGNPR
jgi:hypothetical protein